MGLSSRTGHTIPQLVGDTSNPVLFYDWKDYLSTLFHPIKNVTKFHQFHVSVDHMGVVECREFSDSPVVRITFRKVSKMNVNVSCDNLPKEMLAKGLDLDRQWYIFEHIGELCRTDEAKNCICPKPATDKLQKTDCAPKKTEGALRCTSDLL
ncbi:hypothetical protein DPMN_159369 [Dreissena polymorpha]|uniref:Uncharacterized protein n=1 Tax=Dreissena polymorpha TaxID=45954 RepID=A0A9D4EKX4_DREPO|nr:hypothetical protein DPMN_159369 [Dreissena polymorpha]